MEHPSTPLRPDFSPSSAPPLVSEELCRNERKMLHATFANRVVHNSNMRLNSSCALPCRCNDVSDTFKEMSDGTVMVFVGSSLDIGAIGGTAPI